MLIAAAENLISYVVLLAEFKFPKEFGARFGAQRKTSDAWSRTMSSFAPIYIANDTSAVDPESNSRGTNASLISAFQSAVGLQFLTDAMEAKVRTLAMLGTELRKAIADLTAKVGTLTTNVGTLTTQANTLTKTVNDLKGQVGQFPNLQNVVIEWAPHNISCLLYEGGSIPKVVDTCIDENKNRWNIRPFHK